MAKFSTTDELHTIEIHGNKMDVTFGNDSTGFTMRDIDLSLMRGIDRKKLHNPVQYIEDIKKFMKINQAVIVLQTYDESNKPARIVSYIDGRIGPRCNVPFPWGDYNETEKKEFSSRILGLFVRILYKLYYTD